eukprot:326210-Rhodomonas_salina.1
MADAGPFRLEYPQDQHGADPQYHLALRTPRSSPSYEVRPTPLPSYAYHHTPRGTTHCCGTAPQHSKCSQARVAL